MKGIRSRSLHYLLIEQNTQFVKIHFRILYLKNIFAYYTIPNQLCLCSTFLFILRVQFIIFTNITGKSHSYQWYWFFFLTHFLITYFINYYFYRIFLFWILGESRAVSIWLCLYKVYNKKVFNIVIRFDCVKFFFLKIFSECALIFIGTI